VPRGHITVGPCTGVVLLPYRVRRAGCLVYTVYCTLLYRLGGTLRQAWLTLFVQEQRGFST